MDSRKTAMSGAVVLAIASTVCLLVGYRRAFTSRQLRASRSSSDDLPGPDDKWRPLEYKVLFGVVGGLGPRAMTYFIESLVTERYKLFSAMQRAQTSEERRELVLSVSTSRWTLEEVEAIHRQTRGRSQLLDQDHIPLLAAQATTVPPRPKYILKESREDPTPQLLAVSRGLAAAGATHLAVVCNTAHHFWPSVQQCLPDVRCLDMVRLTLEYVARTSAANDIPVGLLATTATLRTVMYQRVASEAFHLKLISPLELPDGDDRQTAVEKVIFGKMGIKSGFDNPDRNAESRASLRALLFESLKLQRAFGTKTVILACSELPLILNEDSLIRWLPELEFTEQDTKDIKAMCFVDPGKVLAHEMLRIGLLSRVW